VRVLRIIFLLLSGLGLLALMSFAQSAERELPSAPSSTKQQSKPQPPPQPADPAPTQQQSAPSQADSSSPPPSTGQTDSQQPGESSPKSDKAPASAPATSPAKAAASTKSAEEDESATTIRTFVNEVNVVFTVTDKHGHYVRDLQKHDFKVLDDNRPAPEIRSFHTENDLPLQVGLLIDASNSVRDRFKFEQESAIEFLNQTVRPKYDKAFVVGFDATPEVTQDFTDNTEDLSHGVRDLRPGGGTAMYDAVYFACRDKLLNERKTQSGPVRRAIILLSDGDDNQSHVTREESIEMAQRAEVIVYTISTNVTGTRQRGDKVLERIADATGGRAFFPFQLTDVANAFAEIQDELRSQYALSYKPNEFRTDGRFHTIEILAASHKGLKIRSRRGYYAPSQ